MHHKILLGLTTTLGSDWRQQVREIKKFNIKEIALFPTCLKIKDRRELYDLLDKTALERIPHVHLRDDHEAWELDHLAEKYSAEVFNVHAQPEVFEFLKTNKKYIERIYVENGVVINDIFKRTLGSLAGVCVDFSHWEDLGRRQGQEGYDEFDQILKEHKIGCCHVSAMTNNLKTWRDTGDNRKISAYSRHYLSELSELDYIKDYLGYLPQIISIELENSFKEQLEIKKYLEKIINRA